MREGGSLKRTSPTRKKTGIVVRKVNSPERSRSFQAKKHLFTREGNMGGIYLKRVSVGKGDRRFNLGPLECMGQASSRP